jgi:YebC/PmpR family DNA-binding regulatory protein
MSGHSKWATTKRHKASIDSKRGKIFSGLSKDMTLAARASGGDPEFNPRLRTLIIKAKAANMPADNIDRAIKKGTGEIPGVVYEEHTYEGFGPGGVGLMVEVTSDNKNRTVAEVRSVFTKHGGNLASPGALAFNFKHEGQFLVAASKTTEEKLMEIALDAGADDIKTHGDHFEVLCPIGAYDTVSHALSKAGIQPDESELAWMPVNGVPVTDVEAAKKVLRLIESLEELDDVRNVFANCEIAEDVAQAAAG